MGVRLKTGLGVGAFVLAGLGLASPAPADGSTYVQGQPPKVAAAGFGQPSQDAPARPSVSSGSHKSSDNSSRSPLPFTGTDALGLAAVGLGLLGGGSLVRRLGRHPA